MKNKTVIITGAGGNLGKTAVHKYHALGANVVAIYRGQKPTDTQNDILYLENCDLTSAEVTDDIMKLASAHFPTPSILLNVAGGFMWKKVKDTSYGDIDRLFQLNFQTMFNMTKSMLDGMDQTKKGRIINIGAIGAINAGAGMASYAISKSAVMRFTEALSAETPDMITVNAIMPSVIDTPQNRADMPKADFTKWETTEEIVDKMIYLSSDEASHINGELIPVKDRK